MKETVLSPPSNTRHTKENSGVGKQFFSRSEENSFFKTSGIQPKLNIGQSGDKYEQHADAMADKVVSKSATNTPAIQAKAEDASEEKLDKKEKDQKEESTLQRKPMFESEGEPEVQKKEISESGNEDSPSLENTLNSTKGSGSPLDNSTRSEMENGFGNDFGGVRVHTGTEAQQMNKDLNAQAFTHGQDIYFDQGKYNPQSNSGKHLLAHELTHTVQQTGGVQKMIQKNGNVPAKTNAKPAFISSSTITIEEPLAIPKFKERNKPKYNTPLKIPKNFDREIALVNTAQQLPDGSKPSAQSEIWKKTLETKVKVKIAKLAAECKEKKAEKSFSNDDTVKVIYLTNNNIDLIGTEKQLGETLTIPVWTSSGNGSAFDVDHIRELQLGGENKIENMELLHTSANRSSGSVIRRQIADRIKDGLEAAKLSTTAGSTTKIPSIAEAKTQYDIVFNNLTFTDTFTVSGTNRKYPKQEIGADTFWSKEFIEKGDHLNDFKPMGIEKMNKINDNKNPLIYTSEIGGHGLSKDEIANFPGFSNVTVSTVSSNPSVFGTLKFNLKPKSKVINKVISITADIYTMPGIPNGGYIPRKSEGGKKGLEGIIGMMEVDGLSPASITMAEIVPGIGLVIKGKIHPSIEIIKGFDLDFFIEGDNFGIGKTISAGEIKVPPPFKINDAFITIGAGTNGIFVEGDVIFEISKLGTGKISGLGKSNGDFGIKGKFDFDPKLFRKSAASIEVEYNNKDGWSAKGELQIAKDSVKGIKSGNITVGYANNVLEANGTAELTIKGVKEVTLRIKFAEGVSEIEGGIKIEKLPGIKEGEGTLKLVKKGEDYDFSGSGKITPDIPGLTTQLAFEFHNDIFLVDAKVDFEKGRLKGTLNVGITNRAIDTEGKPTGDALPDYKVFGSSELTLKITDKITVSAGVKLLENGEIEVRGGIKLPQKFEVVPKLFSVVEKPLITIPPIHIPLFGIPLGIATIGIEAVIKPKLTADVQIGPGSLTNVQAEIVYNPSQPDDMSITGGADFEFIAEADITAGVDFGISASIAVASLTGGINLSAFIKAAAQQPVFHADIKYSPKTGFELNGDVKALVKAILGFKGDFYAEASIGIWPADYTKRWEWPIFKKEIDTGLQIGFEFPFGYKDGKANLSFENLKFSYPSMEDITTKVKEQIVNPIADKF